MQPMELLRSLYPALVFINIPVDIVLASWLGARFGARATMMMLLPTNLVLTHLVQADWFGMEVVQQNAIAILSSLAMVYTWALCWLLVAPPIERWMQDPPGSHRSAWVSSIASVLLSTAVMQGLVRPGMGLLPETAARLPVLALLAVVGSAILWSAQRDTPPERGEASRSNYLIRLISIFLLVKFGKDVAGADGLAGWLDRFLSSFPRFTFEFVVATQAAQGVRAGKQVLGGLVFGLSTPVGWCLALLLLPDLVGVTGAWIGAGLWTVLSLSVVSVLIRRLEPPATA